MAKTTKPTPAEVKVTKDVGETDDRTKARAIMLPLFRNAAVSQSFASTHFFGGEATPPLGDAVDVLNEMAGKAANGDLAFASKMLAVQAITLDTLFTEMARRSGANMGEYPAAAETYMRLALKAQSNCRATLEALAKLHLPREQTVRHVHVNEGAQAVIAENFHHHTGGTENGKSADQPHTPDDRAAGASAALPRPNPLGDTVPVPGNKEREAVPDARGAWKRRT